MRANRPRKLADFARQTRSIFEQSAKVFDGWTDPETGLRVLKIHSRGPNGAGDIWSTVYHQCACFLDGGRRVLLLGTTHSGDAAESSWFLFDLTTGEVARPFPRGCGVSEVRDGTYLASLLVKEADGERTILWDMRAGRELASVCSDGWNSGGGIFLGDNRRAVVAHFRGGYYKESAQSRHYLLCPGEPPRLVLEADGYHCNHIQGCPTDPDLYSYDRWPTPKRDVDQVIHLRTVDGKLDQPLPLSKTALRPADMWGVRDHYLWTPDGKNIISYLCPRPITLGPSFNHFLLEWWLSVTDVRTGEDIAVRYPAGRWGGHMQVSPDSRHIICCGGPGFDKLFTVDVERLREGWNERVICSYPKTTSSGRNEGPFNYPFVLPDQSGIIFTAGWPGPEHGVYLAEWRADSQ